MPDYPINHNILAEDFRDKTEFTQDDAKWLLDSLHKMCNAYDDLVGDDTLIVPAEFKPVVIKSLEVATTTATMGEAAKDALDIINPDG